MMRLMIAFRNTFRNFRRTLLNLLMIAGGFTAIVVFEGFAINLLICLQEATIKTQTGHMQIASVAYWKKTAKTPKEGLLPHSNEIAKSIRTIPHVRHVSGRTSFFGLLSQGENSLSVRALCYDVVNERNVKKAYYFISGKPFEGPNAFQIIIGSGLATRIKAKLHDRLTLLSNTYDGVVNAIDVEVVGIFQTAISEFDDSTLIIPLKVAQKLLDTTGVEQLVVLLDKTQNVEEVLEQVAAKLPPYAKVRPWYYIAKLYKQVVSFNQVQNTIIQFIIVSLILLSILNTIGMSIFERTGEIGTVAALGETRESIIAGFVLEGLILGVIGALFGLGMSYVVIKVLNALKLNITMPGATTKLLIHINIYWMAYKQAVLLSILASTVAAFIPAIRASRMNIADALRRNI